jgi:hypothetical protein
VDVETTFSLNAQLGISAVPHVRARRAVPRAPRAASCWRASPRARCPPRMPRRSARCACATPRAPRR